MDAALTIRVNRAPVLTLWAVVVAERLGHPLDAALTFGRFVASSIARAKAWRPRDPATRRRTSRNATRGR